VSISVCCKCGEPILKEDVYAKLMLDFFKRGGENPDRWIAATSRLEYPLCVACAGLLRQTLLQAIDPEKLEGKADT
jgi:hypothetical protein